MEGLIAQRGRHKSTMTRVETWYNKNKDTLTDPTEFSLRSECLIKAFNDYNVIQDEIEIEDETQETDRETVENKFFNLLAAIKNKITELSQKHFALNNNISRQSGTASQPASFVKLPEISIEKFTGDITKWKNFYQLFDKAVIQNINLSNAEKLTYLKSFLKNEPLELINNLEINDSNLTVAMDILKDRYDDQLAIIYAHINNLIETPMLSKSVTLRNFLTHIKQNIQALKNLNAYTLDLFLVYVLAQKLDISTKKSYEFNCDTSKYPDIDSFLKFLEDRCKIIERNIPIVSEIKKINNQKVTHQIHLSQNSSVNTSFSNFSCLFCGISGHTISRCMKYLKLTHSDKHNYIKTNSLCSNCLGKKHNSSQCQSNGCKICQKKHHTSLHVDSHHANVIDNKYKNIQHKNNKQNTTYFNQSENNQTTTTELQTQSNDQNSSQPQTRNFRNTQTNCSNSHITQNQQNKSRIFSNTQNQTNNSPTNTTNQTQTEQVLSTLHTSGKTLLATAQVTLYSSDGNPVRVKAVLDPCSTTSLITETLAERLNLKTSKAQISINGVDGLVTNSNKIVNNLNIYSNINDYEFKVNCTVVQKITTKLPQFKIQINKIPIPTHITLADPEFYKPSIISLLLGADIYYSLMKGGIIKIQKDFLTLVDTYLGYIIGGPIPIQAIAYNSRENYTENTNNTCFFLQQYPDDNFLQKFWTIEDLPTNKQILKPEDEQAETMFKDTTLILQNGSFQVNLPLKSAQEHIKLGDSYHIAKKRFINLEKRFKNDPEFFSEYKKFIDEYILLDHGHYIPLTLQNNLGENKYFLPHHAVIKPDAQTTKLRVVFDASAKSTSGVSLNDIMLKGYTVQHELFDILTRFRTFQFTLISDIEKMYRMIRINPNQTFLQNILWRNNPDDDLQCIELLTVTYGTNSAPYLATRVLNELALKNQNKYPLASEAVLQQCYVDDILCGADTLSELRELFVQLNELFSLANFNLHKWGSNSKQFLNSVLQNNSSEIYNIKIENVSNKVLGISWNPDLDYFSVTLPHDTNIKTNTKREVLSKIAQMFDPLGLIGPVIVVAKLIMQKLWVANLEWDDKLNDDLLSEWTNFMHNISKLSTLQIPRYIFCAKTIKYIELHGFSDASLKAYGACAYIRTIYTDNSVTSNLIASKSRVAPLKSITLPRLELCAALLLSNLINKLKEVFRNKFNFSSINLFSDSQITLAWLKAHPSRWTIFVSNRVSEIQTVTLGCRWRHIASAKNPADFLSRGLTVDEILSSELWFHGPEFLKDPFYDLDSLISQTEINSLPEQRKNETVLINNDDNDFWQTLFLQFSSFTRLQRTVAYVLRFVNNLNQTSEQIKHNSLSITELKKSQNLIIKQLQKLHFSQELKEISSNKIISNKAISQLNPFIDEYGLLRVGGRLAYSDLLFNQKHPILLPSKNYITSLLLKREHLLLGHAGPQNVLSNFKLKFWPLNGLKEIKKIIRNCLTCYRFSAKTCQQIMSNLPSYRIKPSRPFSKVGVDFGGPFFIKTSKLRRACLTKCYIAVFVCMVTKAVHIELVSDLSADCFILTLKRFIARRGNPNVIFSDNATNFLGAKNQLKELYDFFRNKENTSKFENFLSQRETEWKFIPPKSPHWGGIWEAAIKSSKYHLYRIIGETHLTFEELSTVLTQIEAILNSRPLLPMSSDPSDLTYLTPGHFLIGDSLTSFPEIDLTEVPENRLTRWKLCTRIQQTFWKKWSKDYLNLLQNRPKWLIPQKDLNIGDLVLLKEDNVPPLKWPRARIIDTLPGKDQKIRVVKLKTTDGVFTRPITKLCPLFDS